MATDNRIKESLIRQLETVGNNYMDEISWNYEQGVLISGNQAKRILELIETNTSMKQSEEIKKESISREEVRKWIEEGGFNFEKEDVWYKIIEYEYPHDKGCEDSMCYCASRARKENPEKWKNHLEKLRAVKELIQ